MCTSVGELAQALVESVAGGGPGTTWVTRTGHDGLDELMSGGLRAGQLLLVGGTPAAGASTFALGIARQAAYRELVPTLLVTSDAEREVAARVLAAETSTPLSRLREGKVDHELDTLRDLSRRLGSTPFFVREVDGLSDDGLMSLVSDWAGQPGGFPGAVRGRVVVLDLTAAGHQWSAARIRTLRSAAIRLRLAVVVVGRLASALPEQQERHLSGIRFDDVPDPASVDSVVILARPELDDPLPSRRGEVEIDVVRNRYGPTGRRVLGALQGHYARIVEHEPTPDEPQ